MQLPGHQPRDGSRRGSGVHRMGQLQVLLLQYLHDTDGNPLCLSALSRHERPPLHLVSVHRSERRRPPAALPADQVGDDGRERRGIHDFDGRTGDLLFDVPHHPRLQQVHREHRPRAERQTGEQGRPARTSLFRPRIRPLHAVPDLRRHALSRQGARRERRVGHGAADGLGDLFAVRRGVRPTSASSPPARCAGMPLPEPKAI